MLRLFFLGTILLTIPASAQITPRPSPDAQPTAYVGGQWFDGERFLPRDTMWADRGVFVPGPLAARGRVVDLGGRYVVPPYGDAHQHMLDTEYSAQFADSLFLDRGTFYVLAITNYGVRANRVRSRFDGPARLDVAYTHGGITSTGSHPSPLYEQLARNEAFDAEAPRTDSTAWTMLGDAYWFWDTPADVEAEWEAFLSFHPDAIKVYLMDVATGLAEGDMRGHGLAPDVLLEVTRRARAAGLTTFAHVNTPADVDRALDAGVDGFAHLPMRRLGYISDPEDVLLSSATIRRLAEHRALTMPTASLLFQSRQSVLDVTRRDTLQAEVARQGDELRALVAAGVPVVLGADRWMTTAEREADYFVEQDLLDPATVLRLWSETTPQAVFPDRAVGRLAFGFEASLLALACNPLDNWSCTTQIVHREKQGLDLGAPVTNPPAPQSTVGQE